MKRALVVLLFFAVVCGCKSEPQGYPQQPIVVQPGVPGQQISPAQPVFPGQQALPAQQVVLGQQVAPVQPVAPTQQVVQPTAPVASPAVPTAAFSYEPVYNGVPGTCSPGGTVALGGREGRLRSIAVAYGPAGGLAVWPMEAGKVQTVPINTNGAITGAGMVSELTGANSLAYMEPLGKGFWLASHAVCPDDKRMNKCLHSRLLGSNGAALGAEVKEMTREWFGGDRGQRISADEIWRLWSFTYIKGALKRVVADSSGVTHFSTLKTFGNGEDPMWGQGFAVDGNRWAALFTDEGEDAFKLFTSDGGAARVVGLAVGNTVYDMAWHQGNLAIVYGPEGAEWGRGLVRCALLGTNGRLQGKPMKVEAGSILPAPFSSRLRLDLENKNGALFFFRRDAAGRIIGAKTQVAVGVRGKGPDQAPFTVAWTGSGYVVVYGTYEGGAWKIYSVPVTCG